LYVSPGLFFFLLSRIEEYIIRGVEKDISDSIITEQEGDAVFDIAPFPLGVPGLFNSYRKAKGDDMLQQVILFADTGHVIPRNVIDEAAKFDKGVSFATVRDGKLFVKKQQTGGKYEKLGPLMDKFKDSPVIFFFSKEDKVPEQPFTILGEGDTPDIVVYLQCTAPFSIDKIKTKLLKEYTKVAGSNLETFWNNIAEEDTVTEIENLVPPASCLLIFSRLGGLKTYEPSAEVMEVTDWGASFGEAKGDFGGDTAAEEAITAKPGDDFDLGGGTPAKPAAVAGTTLKQFPPPPKDAKPARTKDNKGTIILKAGEEWIRCPGVHHNPDGKTFHNTSKEENTKWHMENVGYVPNNWGERPYFPASMRLDKSAASPVALATATKIPSQNLTPEAVKELKTNLYPRMLSGNGELITNPAKFLESLGSFKTVFEELGEPAIKCLLPHLAAKLICVEHPDLAEAYLLSFQKWGILGWQRVNELEATILKMEQEAETKGQAAFGDVSL
jgi:hypothetical protein